MPRLRRRADGVSFTVRLTPKSGRDAVEGWSADGSEYLKARVTAVPQDGKANAALIALLAKTLGVARGTIHIVAGETARMKTLLLAKPSPDAIRRLEAIGVAK